MIILIKNIFLIIKLIFQPSVNSKDHHQPITATAGRMAFAIRRAHNIMPPAVPHPGTNRAVFAYPL